MINSKSEVFIKGKTAAQVFDWMVTLDQEKYLQWHQDHIRYEITLQNETYLGSIVYYEQELEGAGANLRWKVAQVIENEYLVYKALFVYPIRLVLSLTDVENGVNVVHDLRLGFENKILAGMFDWIIKRFVFTEKDHRINDAHVQEEFKNLERLI